MGPHGPLGPSRGPVPGEAVDERLAWATLASVVALAPPAFFELVRVHGSAAAVLQAARSGRVAEGELGEAIRTAAERGPAFAADIDRLGLTILTSDDALYPARLRAIDLAPPVLFVHGDPDALDRPSAVAVVGTRKATESGRRASSAIAGALARLGSVVVSGLAVGIDGAAHAATLAESGTTIGVIAGGHDRIYPRAHERLAAAIVAAGGAIVSEMAPGTPHLGGYFIRRNRLIAGLTDATVVVEAGVRSGALSTARWALEQGRECFLVPGPIDEPRSAGCLSMLRMFDPVTRMVTGVGELMADLELVGEEPVGRRRQPSPLVLAELGAVEQVIARHLRAGRLSVDELAIAADLPVASVLGALTMLELRGLVNGVYGRYRPSGRLASGAADVA